MADTMKSHFLDCLQKSCSEQLWMTIAIVIFLSLVIYEYRRKAGRIPNFRGPSGIPIVGNLWQIQRENAALVYKRWALKYGALYQVQLGNIPVLVINTAASAKAILAQNYHATASRPEFYTFHKVVSNTSATTIGTSPYGPSLRNRRKILATALNRPSVTSYIPHIDRETRLFLKEALESGRGGMVNIDPSPLFLRMNISLGFTLHWGTRLEKQSDVFHEIITVEEAVSNFRSTTSNTQDYIPLVRLNPFSGVSALARNISERRRRYTDRLDRELDVRMETKTHEPCIRANAKLDPEGKLNEMELMSLNATITAAGLDTMQATVLWGIEVLAARPDVQDKVLLAIREKYSETQPLCEASDNLTVQYLLAFIKEVLRCYPATRLSLPRQTIQDITYDGKRIPAGSIIFLNAWACNNDPDVWSDPEVFRPERWLENPEAPTFTFGLGSRMCIGTHLAYRELYVLFIRLVNAFKIESDDELDVHPISGIASMATTVSVPRPFTVKFVPRNLEALERSLSAGEGVP